MPIDHTVPPAAVQPSVALDRWATEIVPQLPPDLEAQAHHFGAFTRRRALATASDLLRGLLAYVLCCRSLRQLGAWALLLDLAAISETAWRKRLASASLWLDWLLGELLAGPPAPASLPAGGRILLVDATTVRQVGVAGDAWRLHLAYDFAAGRLHTAVFTARYVGEVLDHYHLTAGDSVVADAGYGYRRAVAYAARHQAPVGLRINPQTFPLELAGGGPFDLGQWLRTSRGRVRERRWLYCRYQGQRYRVRLVASWAGQQARQAALARKQRQAQKRGHAMGLDSYYVAGWVLLITTVPLRAWQAAEVARLYRARWQVELLFKRLKQLIGLEPVRVRRAAAVAAVLRALLIAWVLEEPEAQHLREQLPQWSAAAAVVSSWEVAALLTADLRQVVQGTWTRQRLEECLPRLVRYLCRTHQRHRQQETAVRRWLQQVGRGRGGLHLGPAFAGSG